MDRRTFMAGLGSSGVLASKAFGHPAGYIAEFGATRPARPRRDYKHFHNTFAPFRGISRALDKNVFLFHNLQKEIGDCVGQATAMGCDIMAATNIHMLRQCERFVAKASVEMLYAGSRIEIGTENNPENPDKENFIRGRGGSFGQWAARFVNEYGVLHRMEYQRDGNCIDLHGYSPERSRKFRDSGVPDWLELFAKEHPVREITNIYTGQEALDAVCAGQPVLMCSSYAFENTRDEYGFSKPILTEGWVPGLGWGRIVVACHGANRCHFERQ